MTSNAKLETNIKHITGIKLTAHRCKQRVIANTDTGTYIETKYIHHLLYNIVQLQCSTVMHSSQDHMIMIN